jgi:putative FmdB family regulatory protein
MPIYDYECKKCKKEFEELARINDPPPIECPFCGDTTICRLISRTIGNVEMQSREYFKNVIEPEAKRIAERIKQGDENALADVIGEDKMR